MIIYIEHIDIEGLGTIETYFRKKRYPLRKIALHEGDRFPKDLTDIQAVIVMGGPMNVYQEDQFPFLKDENIFIQRVLKEEIPYLGICLGSQLLAKASGAKVVKSPVKEVGWFQIDFKSEAKKDPLFKSLNNPLDVFHWHEDMFFIPQDGVWLASALGCPNQAFRVGKWAYGIQFHVEVTEEIIKDWIAAYLKSSDSALQTKAKKMISTYAKKKNDFNRQSEKMYENFEQIILLKQTTGSLAKN